MSTRVLRSLAAAVASVGLLAVSTAGLAAQEDEAEAEEPGSRVVAITTFSMPHHVRDQVIPYMRRHVVPQNQLNPNVLTFRVLIHQWGDDGTEMAFYREYADMAALDAPCGEPCETFRENHPAPEEGPGSWATGSNLASRSLAGVSVGCSSSGCEADLVPTDGSTETLHF